ncbi:hypothetical protein B7R77_03035 [Ralstonia solanacearum K60]|uniref:DUF2513 domain-containing protein n=1 Tax=Ralstonia solanacearum K60 TaxID=1091042 RepID=A0AAP7ZL35_RALSL|nr:DUF2513 domain-containing protein [Ralstonia solanacearum]OYQ12329.1 hypothetical protein B7R77_03035 [Ralstonia solanacearum K60]
MKNTMERDWELVRAILVRLAEQPVGAGLGVPIDAFDGYAPDMVGYHYEMMAEAGLIKAKMLRSHDGAKMYGTGFASQLTWEGQEFLAKIRNDTFWGKVKKTLADKGMSLGFDAIKAAATYLIKSQLPG